MTMTADKSPPLPEPEKMGTDIDSVMRPVQRYGYTSEQMRERDAMWLARLAALTDGAEPVAWQYRYRSEGPNAFIYNTFVHPIESMNRDPSQIEWWVYGVKSGPAPRPSAALVGLAHKGPADFANHECPSESAAVWNTCCMEHVRAASGLSLLPTTAISAVSATPEQLKCKQCGTDWPDYLLTQGSCIKCRKGAPTPAPAESLEADPLSLLKRHNASIYEIDFGDDVKDRYVRYSDFCRIISTPPRASEALGAMLNPECGYTEHDLAASAESMGLYHATNKMLAIIGAEGEIDSKHHATAEVMEVLKRIDGGRYDESTTLRAVSGGREIDSKSLAWVRRERENARTLINSSIKSGNMQLHYAAHAAANALADCETALTTPAAPALTAELAEVRYRIETANAYGNQCDTDIAELLTRAETAERRCAELVALVGAIRSLYGPQSATLQMKHGADPRTIAERIDALTGDDRHAG